MKIKVGIIGIGNMGSGHAKNIVDGKCPDIELVAIADTNPDRLAWAKEQGYGENVAYFDDAITMLDSGLIDSCIIAVPHYDHPRYAIECIGGKIHVMVEKPAGVYTKQVNEMNAIAEQNSDVVFGLMFNQRTNCVYKKIRELVMSGEYGQVRRINWIVTNWYRPQAYYNSGGWRATWKGEGGGVLLNQCPHQLDLLQWMFGMPKTVTAQMYLGKWHDIEVEDDVTAFFEYENGATGVFITSTGDCKGTNRLEVMLDKCKIVCENNEITMTEFEMTEQEFSKTNQKPFGSPNATVKKIETDGENPQHIGVLNAWSGAILNDTPLVANGCEGINGLTLSNAMHLSHFLGKKIELPFDEDLYYDELSKRVKTSKVKQNTATVFADTSNTYDGNK